jgi:selenide,water dikinase
VGSHANKHYCDKTVMFDPSLDPVLIDLMFDAQTSGGLVLGVPGGLAEDVRIWLESRGEMATIIGSVEASRADGKRLVLC